jgi:hypothetical protein
MWLFSSILKASPESPSMQKEANYLGSNVQALRLKKSAVVFKMLWIGPIQRPDPNTCDINSPDSIFSYIARENLECAFLCEPETSVERVTELCKIAKGTLWDKEYIHLTLHSEYADALSQNKSPHELIAYFQAHIHLLPQDKNILNTQVAEFKRQFEQINRT